MSTVTSPDMGRAADSWSATRSTVAALGVLAALTGVEHGVGEISQGRVTPPGLVFESWAHVSAFDPLSGEPAMSLVPDLLTSGVLTVCVAVVLGVWAIAGAHRHHGGLVLIALSLLLLAVGGGFGPPLLGILTGLFATRMHAPGPRQIRSTTRFAARLWPWSLAVAVACFLALVPGVPLLFWAIGLNDVTLLGALTLGAFVATGLSFWSARAHDVMGTASPVASSPR